MCHNCVCLYNIEILNLFNKELQLINTKTIIKNKWNDFLGKLKKFKILTKLVGEYKKIDDHESLRQIFLSGVKLIVNGLDIDKDFVLMHQSVMTKIRNSVNKDWIVKTTVEHSVKYRWK